MGLKPNSLTLTGNKGDEMNRLEFKTDAIGICEASPEKGWPSTFRTLFHRGKVHMSRKYRVWPHPGSED